MTQSLAAIETARDGAASRASHDVQVGIGMGTAGFYISGLGAVLTVLARDLGTPPGTLAWLGSLFGVGLLVAALAGPLLLRRGPLLVLAGGALGLMAGSTLVALSYDLRLIALGATAQALGSATILLAAPALLTGPTAATRLTRVNAAASTVGVLAPLAVGGLVAAGVPGRLALLGVVPPMLWLAWAAALGHRAGARAREPSEPQEPREPQKPRVPQEPRDPAVAPGRSSRALVVRRWVCMVLAVSAEFGFAIWAVSRLLDAGLSPGAAAALGAAFPIGMALGRIAGPRMIARVPIVPVGAAVAAVGTVLVVAGPSPAVVVGGVALAGLGLATLYPVTLAHLMATPGLAPAHGASLGAMASGTAVVAAPAALALLAQVVELRLAFLVTLPILAGLVLLARPAHPARNSR
jgi:MFS family permease